MSKFDTNVVGEFVCSEGFDQCADVNFPLLLERRKGGREIKSVGLFSLRRRSPIGKDMWGVGTIMNVSVRLLVTIVLN